MNIPSLANIFAWLIGLPVEYTTLVFFLTGGVMLLLHDWRISIFALVVQYLTMGAALVFLVKPEIAAAKVLVGLFIGLMLYLSARQMGWRQKLSQSTHPIRAIMGLSTPQKAFPPGRAFRLVVMLLLMVTAISLGQSYPIGDLPTAVSIAVYWLALAGLGLLILSENPLKVGQGLLTIITGFELWYTTLEGSLLVVGLWGIVNLLLALAIGYLAIIYGGKVEEEF